MAVVLHCITVIFKLITKGINAEKVLIVMKICVNAKIIMVLQTGIVICYGKIISFWGEI